MPFIRDNQLLYYPVDLLFHVMLLKRGVVVVQQLQFGFLF